jgi:hypothetical protein
VVAKLGDVSIYGQEGQPCQRLAAISSHSLTAYKCISEDSFSIYTGRFRRSRSRSRRTLIDAAAFIQALIKAWVYYEETRLNQRMVWKATQLPLPGASVAHLKGSKGQSNPSAIAVRICFRHVC